MIVNSANEISALDRSERTRRGWTQKQLADQVGVSSLWISQFERGKPTAHLNLVLRTLKILDVKLWAGDVAEIPQRKGTMVNLDELFAAEREGSDK